MNDPTSKAKKAFFEAFDLLKSIDEGKAIPNQEEFIASITHESKKDKSGGKPRISGPSIFNAFVDQANQIYQTSNSNAQLSKIEAHNASIPSELKVKWDDATPNLYPTQNFGFKDFQDNCNDIAYSEGFNNSGRRSVPRLTPYSTRDLRYATYYLKLVYCLYHNKKNIMLVCDNGEAPSWWITRSGAINLLFNDSEERIIASKLSIIYSLKQFIENPPFAIFTSEQKYHEVKEKLVAYYENTISKINASKLKNKQQGICDYFFNCDDFLKNELSKQDVTQSPKATTFHSHHPPINNQMTDAITIDELALSCSANPEEPSIDDDDITQEWEKIISKHSTSKKSAQISLAVERKWMEKFNGKKQTLLPDEDEYVYVDKEDLLHQSSSSLISDSSIFASPMLLPSDFTRPPQTENGHFSATVTFSSSLSLNMLMRASEPLSGQSKATEINPKNVPVTTYWKNIHSCFSCRYLIYILSIAFILGGLVPVVGLPCGMNGHFEIFYDFKPTLDVKHLSNRLFMTYGYIAICIGIIAFAITHIAHRRSNERSDNNDISYVNPAH
jgi:hypothetical protein